jgi:hypothetical protein
MDSFSEWKKSADVTEINEVLLLGYFVRHAVLDNSELLPTIFNKSEQKLEISNKLVDNLIEHIEDVRYDIQNNLDLIKDNKTESNITKEVRNMNENITNQIKLLAATSKPTLSIDYDKIKHCLSEPINVMNEHISKLNKVENQSNIRAKLGEDFVKKVLDEHFDYVDSSKHPNSGDFMLPSLDVRNVLIDVKNYHNRSIPKEERDKFLRDITIQNPRTAILLSINSKIATKTCKISFELIDVNNRKCPIFWVSLVDLTNEEKKQTTTTIIEIALECAKCLTTVEQLSSEIKINENEIDYEQIAQSLSEISTVICNLVNYRQQIAKSRDNLVKISNDMIHQTKKYESKIIQEIEKIKKSVMIKEYKELYFSENDLICNKVDQILKECKVNNPKVTKEILRKCIENIKNIRFKISEAKDEIVLNSQIKIQFRNVDIILVKVTEINADSIMPKILKLSKAQYKNKTVISEINSESQSTIEEILEIVIM